MNTRPLHPLDPLSPDEIQKACLLLKNKKALNEHYRFAIVRLEEPLQSEVLDSTQHPFLHRLAFLCVFDAKTNDTFEAIVDLSTEEIVNWESIEVKKPPYGQAPILVEEFSKCERIVKADSTWREVMKKQGLTEEEIEKVQVDAFSAGYFNDQDEAGKRVVHAVCYYRDKLSDNGYARPIENIVAVVDLINEKVIKTTMGDKNIPIPKHIINYDSAAYPHKREGLKPLEITQAEGPSFTVNGWEVSWQNWHFRVGFTPREGLILHDVGYQEENKKRSIIYRASVNEMLVPYADPNQSHFWKSAFDAGEYGLGTLAGSLKPNCDCKGHIYYFDVPMTDNDGNAFIKERAICMHEEDAGVLWKHNGSAVNAANEVRRARVLIISFFSTVGNYEYGFFWHLGQEGSIKFEVKLTGIVQTAAIYSGMRYQFGSLLTEELAAPYHQHLFNVRLHMMVDGINNSFSQSEFSRLPINEINPYGTAFNQVKKYFTQEDEAVCDAKAKTQRAWNIYNPSIVNDLGQTTAYQLEVPQAPLLLADDASYVAKRAGFAKHNVWVTPFDPKEKYAAGNYPNQHAGGDGLPKYIQQKRSISDKPLVIWVTFGPTHTPRPEEFPVMPVSVVSIMLKPFGFFSRNPAMDLPKENEHLKQKEGQHLKQGCRM
ncbi:MAG: primary-amine oxidase [Gammaproteobacteria bacterium]|nr:primary-amine oxidase [Gammaproteobacteria bacterium]